MCLLTVAVPPSEGSWSWEVVLDKLVVVEEIWDSRVEIWVVRDFMRRVVRGDLGAGGSCSGEGAVVLGGGSRGGGSLLSVVVVGSWEDGGGGGGSLGLTDLSFDNW